MSKPVRPAYLLYRWLWVGIDVLFPPKCGGCGHKGQRWCVDCQDKVQVIVPPVCECCGRSLVRPGLCGICKGYRPPFTAVRSWAVFEGPVRDALHHLKYYKDIGLGDIFAQPLIRYLQTSGWGLDMVVPVPLGVARLKERGYNQSALLARPLALGTGLNYRPGVLRRIRETRSQVGLSVSQRRDNVRDAFCARPEDVAGQNVLVVDDVATSSATLEACAAALLKGGARQVYGLTVARAVGKSPMGA